MPSSPSPSPYQPSYWGVIADDAWTIGVPVLYGDAIIGVPQATVASGAACALQVGGIADLPKTGGVEAITAGARLYMAAGVVSTTETGTPIGVAVATATQAATTVRCLLYGAVPADVADSIAAALATASHQLLVSDGAKSWDIATVADESVVGRTAAGTVGSIAIAEGAVLRRATGGAVGGGKIDAEHLSVNDPVSTSGTTDGGPLIVLPITIPDATGAIDITNTGKLQVIDVKIVQNGLGGAANNYQLQTASGALNISDAIAGVASAGAILTAATLANTTVADAAGLRINVVKAAGDASGTALVYAIKIT